LYHTRVHHSTETLDASHAHSCPTRRSSDLVRAMANDCEMTWPCGGAIWPVKNGNGAPAVSGLTPTGAAKRLTAGAPFPFFTGQIDRKSTRLNSSHLGISYAVFCLKKKKKCQ